MSSWINPKPIDVPDNFKKSVGGHPLVPRTLYRRGIRDATKAHAFIDPFAYRPAPPEDMPGLNKAVDILENAIQNKLKIGVWGDFDVDGQTSSAVLVSTLTNLGADVTYHIPDRVTESHGINLTNLKILLTEGVQVLISCDTGISDHVAIDYAIQSGIQVVITDHHDLPDELPGAHAVVNPKLLENKHPLRTLPGVGVAYKVAEELYSRSGKPERSFSNFDLVALGIVADLALQINDTRYLLQRGLNELQQNPRAGLSALLDIAGIDPKNVTEEHIGYILGPRLNALGRMSDAGMGVELLLTDDHEFARECAIKLEELNEDRRLITQQVFKAAESQIEADQGRISEPALVLDHPTWPVGVIGIVASRLVEHYHKPAIVISSPPDELARGSARSIEGINITEAIAAQKDCLETYGGHPMAAGFSIRKELLPQFKKALLESLETEYAGIAEDDSIQIDEYFRLSDLTLDLVSDLERLAPFGPGNPALILASRNIKLKGYAKVGRNDEHLILTLEDKDGNSKQAIWWQGSDFSLPEREFDLAYTVRTSTYRGQKEVQIEWRDYRYTAESPINIEKQPQKISVIDYRGVQKPQFVLDQLLSEKNIIVWREGSHQTDIKGSNRYELKPADQLVIWTIPPGPSELKDVVKKVNPSNVYIFGVDPGMDNAEAFITRLAGLLKYVLIKKQGVTNIYSLSAACAQRVITVKEGIKWLQARGYYSVEYLDEEKLIVSEVSEGVKIPSYENSEVIKSLLRESAAYRAFFLRADKDSLLFQGQ